MTGAEIKTMAENILDGDTIDDVFFYQLLNSAKDTIEDSRPWMFLRKLNSSVTASTGNNYNTPITLPTDWRRTWKLFVGSDMQYFPVPFDQQHLYANSPRHFVVDVASGTYYLLGTIGRADTIYHYYLKTTDDITSSTSPVWPARFHKILGFYVAGYIQMGVDSDDIFARMAPANKAEAQMALNSMEAWDSALQANEQNGQIMMADSNPVFDLGSL